jgi:hypothetical protein
MPAPQSTTVSTTTTLRNLRKLSNFLDKSLGVPGTPYSIGLDPIIGLVPGGGDLLTGLLSFYIVFKAAQLGLPRETLVRLVVNILIDVFVGTIPLLGDFFDVVWKANSKNMDLLETHFSVPQTAKKADRLFIFLLLGGLLITIFAVSALVLWAIASLFQFLGKG